MAIVIEIIQFLFVRRNDGSSTRRTFCWRYHHCFHEKSILLLCVVLGSESHDMINQYRTWAMMESF
jgi:hypothetical protein